MDQPLVTTEAQLSDELRDAITGLIGWFDAAAVGGDPTIVELDSYVRVIEKTPIPGPVGKDLDTILGRAGARSRTQLVVAIDRLRCLLPRADNNNGN